MTSFSPSLTVSALLRRLALKTRDNALRPLDHCLQLLAGVSAPLVALLASTVACSDAAKQPGPVPQGLVINEVVSKNEGVWVDEAGETDDYIELYNAGTEPIHLSEFVIADKKRSYALPDIELQVGATQLLWADETPKQGKTHLPFKVDADGETLTLGHNSGTIVDSVTVPALEEHRAYVRIPDGSGAFVDCAFATPARKNGSQCGQPQTRPQLEDISYQPYTWPEHPQLPQPLSLTELALQPADFVEVRNNSNSELDLSNYQLRIASRTVGTPWPDVASGSALTWPSNSLMPGEVLAVAVPDAATAELLQSPQLEGVVGLFELGSGTAIDRLDFMSLPDGAAFSEFPAGSRQFRLCENTSPGAHNSECAELASRKLTDRDRWLLTASDFHALAAGTEELGTESVKFIIDLNSDSEVTFLSSAWELHFMFTRQVIDGEPAYDRCTTAGYDRFMHDWRAFSDQNYGVIDTRRYLLGTVVKHAGIDLGTIEFAPGDYISGEQMRQAFFTIVQRLPEPQRWVIRPQAAMSADQTQTIRSVEGSVPIVGPNAPYRGVTFQPLSAALSFGTLRFVATEDFASANLSPRDIVVTDDVPLDVPLVGGVITEALQTPLSHVNVLSRARKTPNMALVDARNDARVAPYLDKLVRLQVLGSDFSISEADPEEALKFWQERTPNTEPLTPRLDTTTRGIVPLDLRSLADLPTIGGKAAQMAELGNVALCPGTATTPAQPFAIAVADSIEHFERSGARALLAELESQAAFKADAKVRELGLESVRDKIQSAALDPDLHKQILTAISERWPGTKIRFRSSSNVEDLAGFNGAGLYDSDGLEADELPTKLDKTIKSVWASLYRLRAYDERVYYNIDQTRIAMGILVHPAFPHEKVNGVAISRNVLNPMDSERYYYNTQVGEALVTNPAPGVISEESSYESGGWLPDQYYSYSTFSATSSIMSEAERQNLWCNLNAIHRHFRELLDAKHENGWFAMDIEFKLMGETRDLVIKQARPYSFGASAPEGWCDFY